MPEQLSECDCDTALCGCPKTFAARATPISWKTAAQAAVPVTHFTGHPATAQRPHTCTVVASPPLSAVPKKTSREEAEPVRAPFAGQRAAPPLPTVFRAPPHGGPEHLVSRLVSQTLDKLGATTGAVSDTSVAMKTPGQALGGGEPPSSPPTQPQALKRASFVGKKQSQVDSSPVGPTHRAEPATASRPPANRNRQSDWLEPDLVEEWKHLSHGIQVTRLAGTPGLTTPALRAASRTRTPFAPAYLLWVIDNFKMQGDSEGARAAVLEWEQRFAWDAKFRDVLLLRPVLRASASIAMTLCDLNGAEHALRRLVEFEEKVGDPSEAWLRLGFFYEENGQRGRAINAYEAGAKRWPGAPARSRYREEARRTAARLQTKMEWFRDDATALARELMCALRRKDEVKLRELASPTSFVLGPRNGDTSYGNTNTMLRYMFRDLRHSRVIGNPEALTGEGTKKYLESEGWAGETLTGQVSIILRRVPRAGWEWSGLAPSEPSVALFGDALPFGPSRETVPEPSFVGNGGDERRPLHHRDPTPGSAGLGVFDIKAPWPAPRSFMAGGYAHFFDRTRSRPCGHGTGGYYYGQMGHEGRDRFAIDFHRYGGSFDKNLSQSTPVLAIAKGEITRADGGAKRGQERELNQVDQRLGFWDIPRTQRYTVNYVHLDGPDRLIASVGAWVNQGFVLGFIDDTGFSAGAHLHMAIFDTYTSWVDHSRDSPAPPIVRPAGGSVMITPLDGTRLEWHDNGTCVRSTNNIMNHRAYCRSLVGWLLRWHVNPGRWRTSGEPNRVWTSEIDRLAREWGYRREFPHRPRMDVLGLAFRILEFCVHALPDPVPEEMPPDFEGDLDLPPYLPLDAELSPAVRAAVRAILEGWTPP